MDNPNTTQEQRILDHLMDVGSISGIEAQSMYKVRSLTRRITSLRRAGYDIYSEWKVDHTGQRYVRYWLRSKAKKVAA